MKGVAHFGNSRALFVESIRKLPKNLFHLTTSTLLEIVKKYKFSFNSRKQKRSCCFSHKKSVF